MVSSQHENIPMEYLEFGMAIVSLILTIYSLWKKDK
ncbi:hypothetical protein GmarT_40870 [Gimesia maris]|uniref:Uncharacterized protein n=1 Tax=Gimesia maris TaxID=122 RepID=A0ABX5YRD8_9PLAN|nr:hypothetical protein GmarT_40870 [Gimesia maris]